MKYNILVCKYLKIRAKSILKAIIYNLFNVFLDGTIHFNILKSGPNQEYNFSLDNFNLQALKWVGPIEQMTPTVFIESILTPTVKKIIFDRTK